MLCCTNLSIYSSSEFSIVFAEVHKAVLPRLVIRYNSRQHQEFAAFAKGWIYGQ